MIKRPAVILAVSVAAVILIGAGLSILEHRTRTPVPLQTPAARLKAEKTSKAAPMPAPSTTESQESFIGQLDGFLFVSLDDVQRGWGERHIDVAAQRAHFTTQGWDQYQAYVIQQKKTLKKKRIDRSEIPQSRAELQDTQFHSRLIGGHTDFSAKGYFCYGFSDAYDCDGKIFTLRVSFTGDVASPENVLIDTWSLQW